VPPSISKISTIPCLFDKLIDQDPHAGEDSPRFLRSNLAELRSIISRDLTHLFNTRLHDQGPVHDFENYPQVQQSVLNYGTYDLTGKVFGGMDFRKVEISLIRSIQCFEPRIMQEGLNVRIKTEKDPHYPNLMSIEITGSIWGNPALEPFMINARMDLESGFAELQMT
jgi:type VI secretion system lysozyme-like protein